MRTHQQIYEYVRNYYASGNSLGFNSEEGTCVYKEIEDEVEYRCAIGCQLTDLGPDGWTKLLNDAGAIRDLEPSTLEYIEHIVGNPGSKLFNFQAELQNIHDTVASQHGRDLDHESLRDELLRRLDGFAISQGLRVVNATN